MKKLNSGFTLVELAIVMTIIGLLIGGILQGQELINNTRITTTIAQVGSYEAATTAFFDTYAALPGDMRNAAEKIPGCGANVLCNSDFGGFTSDSMVGMPTWASGLSWASQVPTAAPVMTGNAGDETVLFWLHLLSANFITDVTPDALSGAAPSWGGTHPSAKSGGGFIVGWGDGTLPPGMPAGAGIRGPSGLTLALVSAPAADLSATAGIQPLTPMRAAQIDRKMDNGFPRTGSVQAYGLATSCFAAGGARRVYLEGLNSFDCGLVFRMMN